jgi:hypothetical protein
MMPAMVVVKMVTMKAFLAMTVTLAMTFLVLAAMTVLHP